MKKKIKMKKFKFSKRKVIRNFTIIGIFILLFLNLRVHAYEQYNTKTIIVSKGQTLWSIAKEEKKYNSYYENKDIREIVNEIRSFNSLNSSIIYKGQKLQIISN